MMFFSSFNSFFSLMLHLTIALPFVSATGIIVCLGSLKRKKHRNSKALFFQPFCWLVSEWDRVAISKTLINWKRKFHAAWDENWQRRQLDSLSTFMLHIFLQSSSLLSRLFCVLFCAVLFRVYKKTGLKNQLHARRLTVDIEKRELNLKLCRVEVKKRNFLTWALQGWLSSRVRTHQKDLFSWSSKNSSK